MCKTDGGVTKPMLILTRDGHDGPWFPATRQILVKIFMEHNLDFIYCAALKIKILVSLIKMSGRIVFWSDMNNREITLVRHDRQNNFWQ